jgi:hypothetical protein
MSHRGIDRRRPRRRHQTTATRPPRVGVVTNGLAITGGVERCVLEDTRDLVAAGLDVEVWHRPALTGPADAGRAPYDRLGVRLHRASDYRFTLRSAFGDAVRFVRQGLALRRARLDVLWLNRPEFLPWGRLVSTVARVPLVVHLHHAPNYARLGLLAGGRTEYLAVSHAMARAWAAAGVPPQRITVVPNGVDTDAFPASTPTQVHAARVALGIDDATPTVLYYGRLTPSKGVLALLEAWGRVLAAASDRLPVTTVTSGSGSSSSSSAPRREPRLVLAGALYPTDAPACSCSPSGTTSSRSCTRPTWSSCPRSSRRASAASSSRRCPPDARSSRPPPVGPARSSRASGHGSPSTPRTPRRSRRRCSTSSTRPCTTPPSAHGAASGSVSTTAPSRT